MIHRTSKIALEAVGVAVAVTAVLLAVLAWRLSTGPISLPVLSRIIEDAVRNDLQGGRLRIGETILRWAPEERQLGLRLEDVRLTGADGNRVAVVPELAFRLSVPALLIGRLAPTYVDFYGIRATIVRRRGAGISLGLASASAEPESGEASAIVAPLLAALAAGERRDSTLGSLRHVGIHDATLSLVDEVSGVTLDAPNANLAMYRGDGGVAGTLIADVRIGDTLGHIELNGALPPGGTSVEVDLRAMNIVPAALARLSPSLSNYALFDAPLGARGTLDMSTDGTVNTARLSVDAGKGTFMLPGLRQTPVPLEKAHAELVLDAKARQLDLKQLILHAGPHGVSLSGRVDYTLGTGLNVSSARVELDGGETTTEMAGFFEGPVKLDRMHFAGTFDFDARSIAIEEVSLGVAGGKISAAGKVGDGPRSPSVDMTGSMSNIPVNTVRAIWPLELSRGARDWVARNMRDGTLVRGDFRVDTPADMLADAADHKPIPNDLVRFEFEIAGTSVSYLGEMPPMTGVVARGLVQGDRFDAWVSSAEVTLAEGRSIAVSNGHFADGALAEKGSVGDIEFSAAGATADILMLLDREPLKLIRKFGLDPSTIGGTGSLDARLSLPLTKTVTIDEVDFSGTARAEKIGVPNIRKDLSVTGGSLDVDVRRAGLKAKGPIQINGSAPMHLVWSESFVATKGPGSIFELSGRIDDASRTAIGLPLDDFLSGTADVKARLVGKGAEIDSAVVHAELSDAIAKVNELGWLKPVGEPATVDLKIAFVPDEFRFTDFVLAGADIDAKGTFTIGKSGRVLDANFPVVKLGPANDLVAKARRDEKGTLLVDIVGAKADARGLLHAFISGSGDKSKSDEAATRVLTPEMEQDASLRSEIRAEIGDVTAQNETKFSGLKARFTQIDGDVFLMDISAVDQGGQPFDARIVPSPDRTRKFSMRSSDAGSVLRALDLFKSVQGGTLAAEGTFDDKLPGSPMKGEFSVDKFRVVNASVLANILTLGSLTGIRDTLNGEGIYFDSLKLPFEISGHRIRVDDARMSGPAIGLTMKGEVDRSEDVVAMEGTLVPAYTINSILGKVPLLGPLIVGREGEGIFGFTYGVKGNIDDPSVVVNPLSAIAPGFLRRLFEFSSALPEEKKATSPSKGGETPKAAPPRTGPETEPGTPAP